jgi:hypothetical protein
MENISLNLGTKITFEKETQIPAGIAIDVLKIINESFYKSELQDLYALREEFPEIPLIVFDATEIRMQREKTSAILVRGIQKGSVEIIVVGTGLLIWVLKQTLGETLKEAWIESNIHKRIKNFLLGRRSEKHKKIREESKRMLEYKLRAEVHVGYIDDNKNAQITCNIWFFPPDERPFPRTPDELFD